MSQRPRRRLAGVLLGSQPAERLVALAREGREPAFEEIVRSDHRQARIHRGAC